MRYEIVVGPRALEHLPDRLPAAAVDELERQLRHLASDPVRYGAAIPPGERLLPGGPAVGQRYLFSFETLGRRLHFAVYFYYLENERDLRVYDVEVDESPR